MNAKIAKNETLKRQTIDKLEYSLQSDWEAMTENWRGVFLIRGKIFGKKSKTEILPRDKNLFFFSFFVCDVWLCDVRSDHFFYFFFFAQSSFLLSQSSSFSSKISAFFVHLLFEVIKTYHWIFFFFFSYGSFTTTNARNFFSRCNQ